jgi:hypothetical protein
MEDCPLCLNEFSTEDYTYALKCPTPICNFNYCADCIRNLQQSAADGYQEASDGSKQLKVQVKCPQCREKYQCKTYPSDMIVGSVLILRKAASMESIILNQHDSELSATQLTMRSTFREQTSLEELQDAVRRLQFYEDEVGKNESRVQPLDWEAWRPHVRELASSRKATTGGSWRDPTLFHGLDELITGDEQEFVTALLISGKVECLSQAAHILSGILDMTASRTVEQLSSFTAAPGPAPTAPVDAQTVLKIRKRYPLPTRMPRCVRLQVYDPSSSSVLKFDKKSDCLALVGIKGPAGRLGLRKGDVVTHVNGEAVSTVDDYLLALQRAQGEETLWLIVNADTETAENLRNRAEKMRNEKVPFAAS